jgi:Ser/Thr protein kinase RdoA (MazF antagonist)
MKSFEDWNSGQHAWQGDDLKPPAIPISEESFGLIHGDLTFENLHLDVSEKQLQIGVFDWEMCQKSWFLVDLGTLVFEANFQL